MESKSDLCELTIIVKRDQRRRIQVYNIIDSVEEAVV